MSPDELDALALENFRTYLRFPTVHPDPNFDECIKFLKKQAVGLGLPVKILEFVRNRPIVLITWEGVEPQLKTILLNGHMDVVPVFEDKWTRDPFGAEMDENGNIYARGAQDMKCVNIQYLEAIRRLKLRGVRLRRTIHVSFMPDEEIGGEEGMKVFVKTKEFEALNVGFAMDECGSLGDDRIALMIGEKCIWRMVFRCRGTAGHGSLLLENTPGEKLAILLKRLYAFRETQMQLMQDRRIENMGKVISLNMTIVSGGVQNNVIPDEFVVTVDSRIPSTTDVAQWEKTLKSWCEEAGDGVTLEFLQKENPTPPTKLDESNPYWIAFKKASDELKLKLVPIIIPASTDIRYVRAMGIPTLGFSPMTNTEMKMHDHDEYLHKDVFLKGVSIFEKVIFEIGNVKA